jgi:hypothetical protein
MRNSCMARGSYAFYQGTTLVGPPLRATRNNNFFRSLFSSGAADRCQPRTLVRGERVFKPAKTFP